MIPIQEMYYSRIGFVYPVIIYILEKSFDVVLAMFGTWLGYFLAKKHLERSVKRVIVRRGAADIQIAFFRLAGTLIFDIKSHTFGTSESQKRFQDAITEYKTTLSCYLSLGVDYTSLQEELKEIAKFEETIDPELLQQNLHETVNTTLRRDGFMGEDDTYSIKVGK